jgi:hypothetical protein
VKAIVPAYKPVAVLARSTATPSSAALRPCGCACAPRCVGGVGTGNVCRLVRRPAARRTGSYGRLGRVFGACAPHRCRC